MLVLGQHAEPGASGFAGLLEAAPSDAIMVMFIVFIVFSSFLLVAVTFFVTNTIRSIRISSINANLAEKLVRQGVPCDEIERIVRANHRRLPLHLLFKSKWRKPEMQTQHVPGKPAPLNSPG